MSYATRKLDDVLPNVPADEIKSMVRVWGGLSTFQKAKCVEWIREKIKDPKEVDAAFNRLTPFEHAALALIKQNGGVIEIGALLVGLVMTGVALPPSIAQMSGNPTQELGRIIIRRGIALCMNDRSPTHVTSYDSTVLYVDTRLLAVVTPFASIPLNVKGSAHPTTRLERRPASVALTLVGLLQTVADLKEGIGVTQKGEIRSNDQRKIQKAMQWDGDAIQVDGLRFHDPTTLFLNALRYSPWVTTAADNSFYLSVPPAQIAQRTYPVQIRELLQGVLQVTSWLELERFSAGYYVQKVLQARNVLLMLLTALPTENNDFYVIDDLDSILFARVGSYFSLTYAAQLPYKYNKTAAEIHQMEQEWRTKLRTKWLQQERPWLEQALKTWVYFLGLVELGIENHKLVSIRLSQLGRQVLHPTNATIAASVSTSTEPVVDAWVVQPNFEVLVYLERVTSGQLAFLERHAERIQSQQHIAQYRITRERVYQGLESGSSLDEVLRQLRGGMKTDLPQNIVVEIKGWAAQREQITLYRNTHLIEFQTTAQRQKALTSGVEGQRVGERFLLCFVNTHRNVATLELTKIDYSQSLPTAFRLHEEGRIDLLDGYSDLLIEGQLDQWAERTGKHQWQLTETKVKAAIKAGASSTQLLEFLTKRAQFGLPHFLRLALLAWAGVPTPLELESVTLLHCPSSEVLQAIEGSILLRPYLVGRLSGEFLVVKTSELKKLQTRLKWAGILPLERLEVKKLRG